MLSIKNQVISLILNDSVFSTHTGFSIQNERLTTLSEFTSSMFTALIYSYTCKSSHDQCEQKETRLAHVSIPQNVPGTQPNTVKNDDFDTNVNLIGS